MRSILTVEQSRPYIVPVLCRSGFHRYETSWSCDHVAGGRVIYITYIYIWCSLNTTSRRRSVLYICIRNLYSAARRKLKCKTDDFKRNIAVLKHTARLHHYKKTTTLSVGWRILGVFDIMSAATLEKSTYTVPCVFLYVL